MPAGYSGTPLPRKLGIEEDARVATQDAPAHFTILVDPLPRGVRVTADPVALEAGEAPGGYDVVVAFMVDQTTLGRRLGPAHRLLSTEGGLWLTWPKKSSPLYRDLAREQVRDAGLAAGLVDNKVCAIDDDWSALRFVYRLRDR